MLIKTSDISKDHGYSVFILMFLKQMPLASTLLWEDWSAMCPALEAA